MSGVKVNHPLDSLTIICIPLCHVWQAPPGAVAPRKLALGLVALAQGQAPRKDVQQAFDQRLGMPKARHARVKRAARGSCLALCREME